MVTSMKALNFLILRWTVDDLVDYYSPVMEMLKQGQNIHQDRRAEQVEALEHFLDVEVSQSIFNSKKARRL